MNRKGFMNYFSLFNHFIHEGQSINFFHFLPVIMIQIMQKINIYMVCSKGYQLFIQVFFKFFILIDFIYRAFGSYVGFFPVSIL